jgi:hypothetical protein
VEEVPVSSIDPGFYSRLFIVPKKRGGMRPVIDLSILNTYLDVPHVKTSGAVDRPNGRALNW